MKTIAFTACLYIFISLSTTLAQTTYLMSLSNASRPNSNTFEFDVNIKSTNTDFILTSYQCALTLNADDANGNLSFSYITNTCELSNIPFYAMGINNKDGASKLTFASSAGIDTIKSAIKRVGRFRIVNNLGFTDPSFNINWNFTGSVNTIITSSNFNSITNPAFHSELSFTADTTTPKVLGVKNTNKTSLEINFSKAIKPELAKLCSNYFINNGILVNNADLSPNGTCVTLTTSEHIAGLLYTITVSNVKDSSDNLICSIENSAQYSFAETPKLYLTVYPLDSDDDGYLYYSRETTYRTVDYCNLGNNRGGYRHGLVRFPNAGMVAGKTIDSAFVYLTARGSYSNPGVKIRIAANDTVNAQPISSKGSIELGKTLTSAKVDWNPIPAWQSGNVYQSPDIKTIIQEWADLPNHNNATDALLLFFSDNSSSTNGLRAFSQWDHIPSGGVIGQEKAKLVIYYHAKLPQIAEDNEIENLPEKYELCQNYPNPFNPTTTIQYQIPRDGLVTLKVYDILGSELITLVNEQKSTGIYKVSFDASELASGTYIYAVKVNDFISTKKMILLK